MRRALEILGFGPCYHMFAVFEDDKRAREWQRIYREILEGNDSPNFTDAFRGFPASVDDPGALLWREVLKQYPDVKVILNTREANNWWRSCENTINNVTNARFIYPGLVYWVPRMYQQWVLLRIGLLPLIKKRYGHWGAHVMQMRIDEVRAGVPASQLLEYKLGSGWEPLCKFLDVPIPDVPFPNENDKNEISKFLANNLRTGLVRWAVVAATLSVAVGVALKVLKT